jgi:hypothetical protein
MASSLSERLVAKGAARTSRGMDDFKDHAADYEAEMNRRGFALGRIVNGEYLKFGAGLNFKSFSPGSLRSFGKI